MIEKYKTYPHTPAHLFESNSIYMVTGGTYKKRDLLRGEKPKLRWYTSLVKACQQYNWQILAWVILDNHYHIMLEAPEEAGTLVNLIRDLHRIKGLWIKRKISIAKEVKKVWYNYWDTCITYERSFLARLNMYIITLSSTAM